MAYGNKENTNWTEGTTNLSNAVQSCLDAIERGQNAWIEVMENKDIAFPIKVKNPALNSPFNWGMMYGVMEAPKPDAKYFNETEKDLTENWYHTFGTKEAVEAYQKDGTVIENEIMLNGGVGHVIPFELARQIRLDDDGYDLAKNPWSHGARYQPKNGIPYHISDPKIGLVFVIVTDGDIGEDEKIMAVKKVGAFMLDHAEFDVTI